MPPTFAELAGVEVPADRQLDGTSLRGVILDGEQLPPRKLFFGYEPKLGTAMRDGHWKMIVKQDNVQEARARQEQLLARWPNANLANSIAA